MPALSNDLHFERVTGEARVAAVAGLALAIWNEHYVPVIGQAQVDYMIDRFQSAPAIAAQIRDGVEYWLMRVAGAAEGYCALIPDAAAHSAMLSKFYIHRRVRGRGYGRAMIQFVEARCGELDGRELWLTVNRHNAVAIAVYQRLGFAITGTVVKDIGGGFVMDDFRMAKRLVRPQPEGG